MLSSTTFWPPRPECDSIRIEDMEDEDDLAVSNPEDEAEDDSPEWSDLLKLGEVEVNLGLKVEVGTRSGGG